MTSKLVLLFCFASLALAVAEDQVNNEEPEEETGLLPMVSDFTVSAGMLRAISVFGAVVTGAAGLTALLSFILPLIGLRVCSFMGNCEDTTAYNPATNSVYDQQGGYQYNGGFKKRSLEYVGPILKALTSAYDKYGPPAQQQQRKVAPKPIEAK